MARAVGASMAAHATSPDVESFYHLPDGLPSRAACRGLACFVARHDRPDWWERASSTEPRVYCLGQCYRAPAEVADPIDEPAVEVRARHGIVLGGILNGPQTREAYRRRGGYASLERARRQRCARLVDEIDRSGLRGRGGAGFPTGAKWRAIAQESALEKFIVANGDEGDAGAFVDRILMERAPHQLIDALVLAAHAIGATRGYVYVRAEYPRAVARVIDAIDEARHAGYIGADAEGTGAGGRPFDLEVVVGRGSYVCGEETALLNAIEGRRPEARTRPPYPTTSGLFGRPTLVQNIETLTNVPWIAEHGGDAYRALGYASSRGTKVVCLNSLFRRPGLYEIEFGWPVRRIVDELGGGLRSGPIKGVIIGGPLARILPPSLFDTPFAFEDLRAVGAAVGHGGVIAFDDRTSVLELAREVFSFGAFESCGTCTPCRLGTRRIEAILERALQRRASGRTDAPELVDVVSALAQGSLCGHGTGLAEFAASALKHYREEFPACFV
jgi:NADH:ubiquinone oxidoreductase subunit F (NADH-binding)